MGRPLKIAKSQFVGTITGTTTGTNIVTFIPAITATVNFTVGMPVVVSTTVSNIIAGTTYWVLTMPSTSSMTLSSTPLDANINRTPLALGTVGPVTVGFTVNLVDYGFNNPNGAANTYSVVGGNTGSYGKQVLARAAIGVAGQATLDVNVATAILNLLGTAVDVSSFVSVGDWIGLDDQTYVGTVIGNSGKVTETTVSAESATDSIKVSDSNTLIMNGAIVFGAAIGGLTAGTTYYVKTRPTVTSITVSLTPGGAIIPLNDDPALVTTAIQNCLTLGAVSAVTARTSTWVYATNEAAFIVRQKGKTK